MEFVSIKNQVATIIGPKHWVVTKNKLIDGELNVAFQSGCTKVVVDLAETVDLPSTATGQLTKIRHQVKPENFTVINAHGRPLQNLKSSSLGSWIKSS